LVAQEIRRLAKMMEKAQGQVDHVSAARRDFRSATKPGEIVSDVAVVLLDPEGQVLAGEELGFGNAAVVAVPVVGQEGPAFDPDLLEELLAGRIVTLTQNPGQGSPVERIEGSPDPTFVFFPFTKCHISSSCTISTSAGVVGSGSVSAAWRIHLKTATSLTPNSRAIMP
jgi:hypothetical protein